jgi:hypothetical protein
MSTADPRAPHSPLLINEPQIAFLPSLAKSLGGANEAIVLQQLHYLINSTATGRNYHHYFDERWWVYNSYEQWGEIFIWLSSSTIKRIFRGLEDAGLVLSRDKREGRAIIGKWYTIDYAILNNRKIPARQFAQKGKRSGQNEQGSTQLEQGSVQNEHSTLSKMSRGRVKKDRLHITKNYTESSNREREAEQAVELSAPTPSASARNSLIQTQPTPNDNTTTVPAQHRNSPPDSAAPPHSSHPFVAAYQQTFQSDPSKPQMAHLATYPTDPESEGKFKAACAAWALAGYRKQNLQGILDWYNNGVPNYQAANPNAHTRPVPKPKSPSPYFGMSDEDKAAMVATWQPMEDDDE